MLSFQKVVANNPALDAPEHPVAAPPTDTGSRRKVETEALRVLDLRKEFRSDFLRRRQRGIDGVSFSVNRGEVFALLGHNGAGKTTTINCILDLIRADGGSVQILGLANTEVASRRRVGYLPERPYFFEHLSGRELLHLYAGLLDVPAAKRADQVESVLHRTGMSAAAGRPLRKYSKGMLQRMGLAQTLLGDPELLILDEPMSGLDPVGRREVRQLLQELRQEGRTIILSSHIVPDVEMLADKVGILCEGRMVETCDMRRLHLESRYEIRLRDAAAVTGVAVQTARDVAALGDALQAARAAGREVLSVETCRSGLEDLFMKIHDSRRGN
ncbi:ABC transporter [bacterium DOLJORAL78_65_58]|nr:MAG: ABC transporter [bacterium DOLZORAL124_64_63]PIE75889.1 MAG: ABC transporter [bacterium DOLJORAL78_65_58]